MDQGGIALNALLREREWKTSNCAVFMRVWAERTFTRVRRVARVSPTRTTDKGSASLQVSSVELPFLWLGFELVCVAFAAASCKCRNQAQIFIRESGSGTHSA